MFVPHSWHLLEPIPTSVPQAGQILGRASSRDEKARERLSFRRSSFHLHCGGSCMIGRSDHLCRARHPIIQKSTRQFWEGQAE